MPSRCRAISAGPTRVRRMLSITVRGVSSSTCAASQQSVRSASTLRRSTVRAEAHRRVDQRARAALQRRRPRPAGRCRSRPWRCAGAAAASNSGSRRPARRRRVQAMRATGRSSSRARRELAFGKERDARLEAALAQGQRQRFEEGALADDDLAEPRIGLGQQPLAVDPEDDRVRLAQVDLPGLPVVRVRREDGVAEGPAAQVRVRSAARARRRRLRPDSPPSRRRAERRRPPARRRRTVRRSRSAGMLGSFKVTLRVTI